MLVPLARRQEGLSCEDLPEGDELRRRLGPPCPARGPYENCTFSPPFDGPEAESLAPFARLDHYADPRLSVADLVRLLLLVARDQPERIPSELARLVEPHSPHAGAAESRAEPLQAND